MTILCGGRVLIGQFGNTTSVGRGTITVVLQHQGETYLITAGHAVGEEGAAVYAPINDMAPDQPARWSDNEQWDQIGKVVRNLYVTGHNNRDVALVKLVNLPQNVQVHFMRVALGQDIHTLAGFRDLDQEGDEVEFVGWRTGHHRALVTNLEATVEVRDEFGRPRILGNAKQLNVTSNTTPLPGDSGAPVFIGDQLVGVFTAGSRNGGVRCAFTPIGVILEAMGWH